MKKRSRSAWFLFLSLPLILWICSVSRTEAADPMETLFPEFGGLNESLHGRVPGATILLSSPAGDPITVGYLAVGVKPWLDLIDKASYSLKLSLPLTGGSNFYNWHEGDSFLGGGLFASVQLKSLPPRLGSWTLNTGLFFIRKDPISPNQAFFALDSENAGSIGAINISIVY